MISSMTGYGVAEISRSGITARAEVRSVNSRFLEVTTRLPRAMALRENDVKDLVRKKVVRGKVNLVVTLEDQTDGEIPLRINHHAAKASYKLLQDLRRAVQIRDKITLAHLLNFSEVIVPQETGETTEKEWAVTEQAVVKALDELVTMRLKEGGELKKDIVLRLQTIEEMIHCAENTSRERIPQERDRLRERVGQLLQDPGMISKERIEVELALMADKLDVTEECVRFRSHTKFFLSALDNEEAAGRKLNFLLQEMNREANTIGAKSSDADIAHKVVSIKEELEKIREQLQNIE